MKKLRTSIEEISLHAELFRNKLPTHVYLFKTEPHERFAVICTQFRDAIKVLVKKCVLRINESVDAAFSVVDDMLQALETELSHFGLDSDTVDYIYLLTCSERL